MVYPKPFLAAASLTCNNYNNHLGVGTSASRFADEETEAGEVAGWVTTRIVHSCIGISGISLSYRVLCMNVDFRRMCLFLVDDDDGCV